MAILKVTLFPSKYSLRAASDWAASGEAVARKASRIELHWRMKVPPVPDRRGWPLRDLSRHPAGPWPRPVDPAARPSLPGWGDASPARNPRVRWPDAEAGEGEGGAAENRAPLPCTSNPEVGPY